MRDNHTRLRAPRGKKQSFYADFRDLGGGIEACKEHPLDKRATSHHGEALDFIDRRVEELSHIREVQRTFLPSERTQWCDLEKKNVLAKYKVWRMAGNGGRRRGRKIITTKEMDAMVRHCKKAAEFFGSLCPREVGAEEVAEYLAHLNETLVGRQEHGKSAGGTQSHYLSSLSNFYKFLIRHKMVPIGHNPCDLLEPSEKPEPAKIDPRFLEHHHAAAFMAGASRIPADFYTQKTEYAYQTEALIATFLMSGGRLTEVRGLRWSEIDFRRNKLNFIKNDYRPIKTEDARTVPLWPQLKEILLRYREACPKGSDLLFAPTTRTIDGMRTPLSIQQTFNRVSKFIKWDSQIWDRMVYEPEKITAHRLRHTYTSVRAQTLDNGAPVARHVIEQELGHSDPRTTDKIYKHIGVITRRFEDVRYLVQDFADDEFIEPAVRKMMIQLVA